MLTIVYIHDVKFISLSEALKCSHEEKELAKNLYNLFSGAVCLFRKLRVIVNDLIPSHCGGFSNDT
jgi:hypothetical protein